MQREFSCLLITTLMLALVVCGCEERCEEKTGCLQTREIVQNLLQESSAFRALYKAERKKIPECICWLELTDELARSAGLPEGVLAATNPDTNTTFLKRIPPRVDDAFVIAHELRAYVLKKEGFPMVRRNPDVADPGVGQISSELNTMVGTPLQDSILSKYGFDLEKEYRVYLGTFFKGPRAPVNSVEEFEYLFFYAKMVLYWEDVLHNTGISDFQRQFDQWYPLIANDGYILLSKIRAFGYETPDKMAALFLDIINEWELQGIIELVRR